MNFFFVILFLVLPAISLAMSGGGVLHQSSSEEIRSLYKYTVRIISTSKAPILNGRLMVDVYQYCTATIVGGKSLLSAGHCMDDITDGVAIFYDEGGRPVHRIPIERYARKGDGLNTNDIQLAVDHGQVQVTKWSKEQIGDLSVVKLSRQIPDGYGVADIDYDFDESALASKDIHKIGFGRNGIGDERPRKVGKFTYAGVRDGHIIGLAQNTKDGYLCKGDSGGGNVYFKNGKPVVIAATSSGFIVNLDNSIRANVNCDDATNLVEFISSVKPHRAWIQSMIDRFEGRVQQRTYRAAPVQSATAQILN